MRRDYFYRKQYLLWGALLIMLLLSGCTASGTTTTPVSGQTVVSPNRSITVIGSGQATGKPDQAQIQIGVETFAPTVAEAAAGNETSLTAVLSAIRAQNVADNDLQTSNYSLWAEQKYSDNGPVDITGYHVSNQVNVIIRDIDTVDKIIGAATEAGANNIYGVTFTVADPSALEELARRDAISDAQSRAADLASLNNVTLGEVMTVSEVISAPGIPLYGMGGGGNVAAAAGPSISPGQLTYQLQVQVSYAVR